MISRPVRSPGESNLSSSGSEEDSSDDSEAEEQQSIGNVDWCKCSRYIKPMSTYTESLCCKHTNEIPEELFEITIKSICIFFLPTEIFYFST